MTSADPFIARILQSTALRVHDAEACEARVFAMMPESPTIADERNVTGDERAAIRTYLPAYAAWDDQHNAAKAELDDAQRAHAQAYRLATGRVINTDSAAVLQHLVNVHGAAAVVTAHHRDEAPRAPANVAPTTARHARPREAGRPARRSTRSSAASGDSGDDGPEPPAESAARRSDER